MNEALKKELAALDKIEKAAWDTWDRSPKSGAVDIGWLHLAFQCIEKRWDIVTHWSNRRAVGQDL